jgi:hypothetical protein
VAATAGRPHVFMTRSYPDPTVAARMDAVRDAMADADAMLIVASAETAGSPWTPFAMGAALATGKPIYVVPVATGLMPTYLQQAEVVDSSAVGTLLPRFRASAAPLDGAEVAALTDLYVRFDTPVSELVSDPVALKRLAGLAARLRKPKLQPDRLGRELARLDQQGRLPALRRRPPVIAARSA